jgi:thioredoxin reductase (NADPH)
MKHDRTLKKTVIRIKTSGRYMKCIVLKPDHAEHPLPGILWIHGGGYVTGMASMVSYSCGKMLAERFGAVTKYGEVVSVELEGRVKKVKTSSDELLSRTVVIATGAGPRELGIEREEEYVGRGVHYCAHCDGRFYKNKVVAVIGGGNSALEDALYLSRLAAKVYLIHRRDSFRASKIYVDALGKSTNIEFLANSSVSELIADERVNGIRLADGRELEVNALFVSIGRKPASEIFRGQLELDAGGYIVADESTRTNIDGVYAVGDVRTKPLRQVVTAVGDGAVAVHFAEEYLAKCD